MSFKKLLLLSIFGLLAACNGPQVVQDAKVFADQAGARITPKLDSLPQIDAEYKILRLVTEKPYIGLTPILTDKGENLPDQFRNANGITLPLEGPLTTGDMVQRIKSATGLGVRIVGKHAEGDNRFTSLNVSNSRR